MPTPTKPKGYKLTRTMDAFLQQLVNDGRALGKAEALRGVIRDAMRTWAKEHGHPFPRHPDEGTPVEVGESDPD